MNNRQAGRRRGRGGQRSQGSPNRIDNGNRIDNRARGNAAQLLEKYKSLARDAQMSGDRVNTEYYLQFADHYFRVLNENRARFEEQRRPSNDEDFDDDGEFEAEASDRDDDRREPRQDRGRPDGNRQDGNRREARDGRDDDDGQRERYGRERGERPQNADRSERADRNERPDRSDRADRRPERAERANGYANGQSGYAEPSEDAAPVTVPAAFEPQAGIEGEPAQAPRRRGRPRRNPEAEAPAPLADSEPVAGLDADRLPPALSTGDAEPAPRRRRRPRAEANETEATPA